MAYSLPKCTECHDSVNSTTPMIPFLLNIMCMERGSLSGNVYYSIIVFHSLGDLTGSADARQWLAGNLQITGSSDTSYDHGK